MTYYIPKKEELRLGFQFEMCSQMFKDNTEWTPQVIGEGYEHITIQRALSEVDCLGKSDSMRVPYLTQQDIESYGFEIYSKGVDSWFKFKESPITHTNLQEFYNYKPYSLYLNYGFHDNKMKITCDFSGGLDFGKSDTLFEGFIRCKNEFEQILKFIKVI